MRFCQEEQKDEFVDTHTWFFNHITLLKWPAAQQPPFSGLAQLQNVEGVFMHENRCVFQYRHYAYFIDGFLFECGLQLENFEIRH